MQPMQIRVDKFIASIKHIFNSVGELLVSAIIAICAFFAPAKLNFYAVGVLVAMDIITAFLAAYMQNKRNSDSVIAALLKTWGGWTSKRAFDSVPKLVWYSGLIITAFIIGEIFDSAIKGANLATGIIAYIEIRSILENGDKAFNTNTAQLLADYLTKLLPKK